MHVLGTEVGLGAGAERTLLFGSNCLLNAGFTPKMSKKNSFLRLSPREVRTSPFGPRFPHL